MKVVSSNTETLLKAKKKNIPRGVFNVHPIFAREGRGAVITCIDGKEYIDFAGGIGTLNAGYCPNSILQAVSEQIEKYLHTCFHVIMYEPYVALAEKLNTITPGDFRKKTMFVNSGAEAVENGVKIARYYTGRPGITAFDQGFHGRTLMGMTLTSKVKPYKFGFGPYAPEVYHMPFPYCYRCKFGLTYPSCQLACALYLEDFFINYIDAEHVAAVIIEPVAGEGGFVIPPKDYFLKLQEICKKNEIVLIIDEVQSGMARTGKLFAIEHFSIEPDIILTAKSLAAGFPLGGVTGKAEIMESPHIGGLGGTFGGNPVACKAALAVLDMIESESLIEKSHMLGKKIVSLLDSWEEKYNIIGDVRYLGAMIGLELVRNRNTKEPAADETKKVIALCREQGLLMLSCGTYSNVLRILAPLVITDVQLEKGMAILENAIKKVNESI